MAQSGKHISEFELRRIQKERLNNDAIHKAVYGLLAYFEDTQIRDRHGDYSSLYHSSESKFKARSNVTYWPSFLNKQGYKIPMFLKVRNLEGEWASQIHAFPNLIGSRGKTPISVQDSNMFVTGFCSMSLLLFDESKLPPKQRIIQSMLTASMKNIRSYKRGSSFNFWPEQEAVSGEISRVGPMNIWIGIAEPVLRRINTNIARTLISFLKTRRGIQLPKLDWLNEVLTNPENEQGVDAIFNIPNDADTTSMAISLEYSTSGKLTKTLEKISKEIIAHRDINRKLDSAHNNRSEFESWLKKETGAYLTWEKAESNQLFSKPEEGLIPFGTNNVDIVVNANVLYMLSLTQQTSVDGYEDCINLLCSAVEQRAWPGAGLYYPQFLMFPYVLSRAIRDGGANHPKLEQAKTRLLSDVLKLAKIKRKYTFFEGGQDKSTHLPTALALCTLLNLGEQCAQQAQQVSLYREVVEGCKNYLLKQVRYKGFVFESTREKFGEAPWANFIAHWEDGLFFGPVHWDLCHWRSQAVTHAVVLEALSKYLCAYDKQGNSRLNNKLSLAIRSYGKNQVLDRTWLQINNFQDVNTTR